MFSLSLPGDNQQENKDIFPKSDRMVIVLFPSYIQHGTLPWNECAHVADKIFNIFPNREPRPENTQAETVQNPTPKI